MLRQLIATPLLLAALVSGAWAGDVKVFGTGDRVDPAEVARILDRSAPIKMRSIKLLDDGAASNGVAGAAAVAAVAAAELSKASALSLPVQFAFDSADILPAARPQLEAIAKGIRMLPAAQSVVIEGHTDAIGSDSYNEQLSQRRALAVRRYLVATHGIDASRLRAVGLGDHATLPGLDPNAAENRRVQFRGE
jgi:outer membrane protein OmpA-like peptidoglycan-associated protein